MCTEKVLCFHINQMLILRDLIILQYLLENRIVGCCKGYWLCSVCLSECCGFTFTSFHVHV